MNVVTRRRASGKRPGSRRRADIHPRVQSLPWIISRRSSLNPKPRAATGSFLGLLLDHNASELTTRSNTYELEKQANPRNTHCSGHDVPHVYASKRRRVTRCSASAVSGHGWGLGDFRVALRETEIAPSSGSVAVTHTFGQVGQ